MTTYHNPYHFVPVKDGVSPAEPSTHDRYEPGRHSGRIICRLTTKSPIFVGAEQVEGTAPTVVRHFEVDSEPALPASSLRGLTSSIAEAASNSALRVLDDALYSYRKTMSQSLSAIGMIVKQTKGEFRLRPLTLPTLAIHNGQAVLPSGFHNLYPVPNLKVYVGDRDSIQDASFPYETFFLTPSGGEKHFYLTLPWRNATPRWPPTTRITTAAPALHLSHNRAFLLAQVEAPAGERPREMPRTGDTRGIMRVLGCRGRDVPRNKSHEVFIPYPPGAETWPTVPIDPEALTRFYELADQRTDADEELPYEPRKTERNTTNQRDPEGRIRVRLKEGDLVFFDAIVSKSGPIVAEISLSSIWRGRVTQTKAARTHAFFAAVDPNLLPLKPERDEITLAEQVFGYVENRGEKDRTFDQARALASRVRFSDGRLARNEGGREEDVPYLPPVTLKILSSPKPPCPALYFKGANDKGQYIEKAQLRPAATQQGATSGHHPQGRKFYLHHPKPEGDGRPPWETGNTESPDQKLRITPVREGTAFYFHVDFENLNSHELGMLCFALRPFESFHHKIGLGKPIGLGTVRIDPVGIFYVDRAARYGKDGLFAPRYRRSCTPDNEDARKWPEAYARERGAAVAHARASAGPSPGPTIEKAREAFDSSLREDVRAALRLLGDPAALEKGAIVHTPLVEGAYELGEQENETFRWFVANEHGSGRRPNRLDPAKKYLEPLEDDATGKRGEAKLPTLPAHHWNG